MKAARQNATGLTYEEILALHVQKKAEVSTDSASRHLQGIAAMQRSVRLVLRELVLSKLKSNSGSELC